MTTPFTDRSGRFSPLKTLTLMGLAAPALWLGYRALANDLGPLAVKEALLFTGLWAVRFLLITLALTPAQRFFNRPRLALIRRMTGVAAFAYALGHLSLYIIMQKFDFAVVVGEIVSRVYLTIGFAAVVGLSALAATSTDAMVRRLGARWKTLHRLVHAIAVLGVLHFFMWSKIDASEATLMAGFFATLMIYRQIIARRIQPSFPVLAGAAALGALATAGLEFAWYWAASGIDPYRILNANLMLAHGLRPAVLVLIAGLAVALAVTAARFVPGMAPPLRPRTA